MAKTPKAIGKNGDLTLMDVTSSVLEWITEAPRQTSKLSDFLFTLPDSLDAYALVDLAEDADPLPKILLLGHAALRSDDKGIAEKLRAAFDAYEFPAMTDRGIDIDAVLVAALLTAHTLKQHIAADDVESIAKERLDLHVEYGKRIEPVFRLLAAIGEVDKAIELHERRLIPWEEDSKELDNTVFYYASPLAPATNTIVAELLRCGRHDDAKAFVARCEEHDNGHSWNTIIHLTIETLANEDPREMYGPLLDVDAETLQRRIVAAILESELPPLNGRKLHPIRENMDHPLLERFDDAKYRLTFGDVTGFREHFSPHPGVAYTGLKYRASILSADEALEEIRENLAKYPIYSKPAHEAVAMFHEALDRENLDDAQKFMTILDQIFTDVEEAGSLERYDRKHIDQAFCRYSAAKCRLLLQEGEQKEAEKVLKAANKRAKAGGERAVETLVRADLHYDFPHLAVGAAMKLPLKDRKAPGSIARTLIADIAAAYLPDDVAGALYTIDKVAGTSEAKILCVIDAFEQALV